MLYCDFTINACYTFQHILLLSIVIHLTSLIGYCIKSPNRRHRNREIQIETDRER